MKPDKIDKALNVLLMIKTWHALYRFQNSEAVTVMWETSLVLGSTEIFCQTERERDGEMDGWIDKERDRQTDRQNEA